MSLLREIRLIVGVLILMIWAHTDFYRHECLDKRSEYCIGGGDE